MGEIWRRLEADGAEWEVRVIAAEEAATGRTESDEILEFRCVTDVRAPRRLAVDAGALAGMDERRLKAAYLQSRPIGGDFYGRPGKTMTDAPD